VEERKMFKVNVTLAVGIVFIVFLAITRLTIALGFAKADHDMSKLIFWEKVKLVWVFIVILGLGGLLVWVLSNHGEWWQILITAICCIVAIWRSYAIVYWMGYCLSEEEHFK